MKYYLIFAFAMLSITVFAQPEIKHTRMSVYFKTDKYELQEKEKKNLDTLTKFLRGKDIVSVLIKGNTDSDADSLYNIELSKNRTDEVKNYFEPKFKGIAINAKYFGENIPAAPNATPDGKQENRRVDVIVRYRDKAVATVEKSVKIEPKEISLPEKDTCNRDTTIELPQGSSYTMNVCDYLKYKDCISIREFVTPESIIESDFGTQSSSGHPLITGGMFQVNICDDPPLKKPLTFNVPVSESMFSTCNTINYEKMKLWNIVPGGKWSMADSIDIIEKNAKKYYRFTIPRGGSFNCDMISPVIAPKLIVKTKFQSKGKIKLIKVRMLNSESPIVYEAKSEKKPNLVTVKRVRCINGECSGNGCTIVRAIGVNRSGDTVKLTKCLNTLEKRQLFGGCKSGGISFLYGFIPTLNKSMYRKYIIRPGDWEIVQSAMK